MLRYTLALIRYQEELLMINRKKKPWKGCWNGIGGKLEPGESAEECIIREIREETSVQLLHPLYQGIATWHPEGEEPQGMYLFTADLGQKEKGLPRATREGILDWKPMDWVFSSDNLGTVPTLRFFALKLLDSTKRTPVEYHFDFDGDVITHAEERPLSANFRGEPEGIK
ncbi:MAG: NUDIX domain-containing protein [Sporolactobacillus sp.]